MIEGFQLFYPPALLPHNSWLWPAIWPCTSIPGAMNATSGKVDLSLALKEITQYTLKAMGGGDFTGFCLKYSD